MNTRRNITRRGFVSVSAAAALYALCACSSTGTPQSASGSGNSQDYGSASSVAVSGAVEGLSLLTGGESGIYYDFGKRMIQRANEQGAPQGTALISDGSLANIKALDENQAQLAFCQSDVLAFAHAGEGPLQGTPYEHFSVVASLYDEYLHLVSCNARIESIADLKGKRVSVGAPNSGVFFNAVDVLAAHGLTLEDVVPTYQGFGDSASSLQNGEIDAAFFMAGLPVPALLPLFRSKEAFFLPIGQECIDKLLRDSSHYARAVIPAGTYQEQTEDVLTVAVSAVLIASNALSSDVMYAFTRAFLEDAQSEEAQALYPLYAGINVQRAAALTTVPYHEGAARYYAEYAAAAAETPEEQSE